MFVKSFFQYVDIPSCIQFIVLSFLEMKKGILYGHRFAFMLHTWKRDLSEGVDESHLCHQKGCSNPEHYSCEPPNIMQYRHVCLGTHLFRCRNTNPTKTVWLNVKSKMFLKKTNISSQQTNKKSEIMVT